MANTFDFEIGDRVKITEHGEFLDLFGFTGTICDIDAYTVSVRLDQHTPEMDDYEDSRTGVVNLGPEAITKI